MRALLLALPFLLVACDSDPVSGPSLDGTAWVLESFDGQTAQPSLLAFQDGQISGVAACNRYEGRYGAQSGGVVGPRFVADVESVTEIACPDGLNAYEDVYLDALETATRWALEEIDDRLTLTGPGVRLVFEPAPALAEAGATP